LNSQEILCVNISEVPIEIIKPIDEQHVKKMPADVTFECELNKSDVDIEWYKNDKLIAPNKKYKMSAHANHYTLLIKDVTDEDDADYTCKVHNKNIQCQAGLFVEGEGIMHNRNIFST
jgi:hypothetical protein